MARARIPPEAAGQRIDHAVAAAVPGMSVAAARRLLRAGAVRIDGQRPRKGAKVGAGQAGAAVEIDDMALARFAALAHSPAIGSSAALAQSDQSVRVSIAPDPALAVTVVFDDPSLVAIAKPAGVPSHPLAADQIGTAANAIVARFPECAGASPDPREGGLVHRLDTGTSGVLVAARSAAVWPALRDALSSADCEKIYLVEVAGAPADSGIETAPIGRVGRRGGRVRVGGGRQPLAAETAWAVIERRAATALLRVRLSAGRHHQVRAHLAAAGFPVVGDARYGHEDGHEEAQEDAKELLHLHAASVRFRHPVSGDTILIEAPAPGWAMLRG